MRFFFRTMAIIWIFCLFFAGLAISIGQLLPAPIVEWASITLYIHDTRTGVNYNVLRSGTSRAGTIISGVQIVPSPNNVHIMTIMNTATGLDVDITTPDGTPVNSLRSDATANVTNVGWVDDQQVLVMTAEFQDGISRIDRMDITTMERFPVGTFSNSFFVISPDRNWLLVNDQRGDSAQVISVWDERRFPVYAVSTSYAWSADGRYMATRANLDGTLGFQLFDTTTGDLITQPIVPNRLSWSQNNRDLIFHNETSIVLYNSTTLIDQFQLDERIVQVAWSPDGEQAFLVTQTDDAYGLYLIDFAQAPYLQYVTDLPTSIRVNSISWALDAPYITYVGRDSARDVSPIYRTNTRDGRTQQITEIPLEIRQIRYIETLENYFNR